MGSETEKSDRNYWDLIPKQFYAFSLLALGTVVTIDMKLIYHVKAKGLEDSPEHYFAKPWMSVLGMFLGMSGSLPLYFITGWIEDWKNRNSKKKISVQNDLEQNLLESAAEKKLSDREKLKNQSWNQLRKMILGCCFPASCDLT